MDSNPTLDELPGLLAAELIQITPALASTSRAIICGILDDAIGRALAAEAEIARLQARVAELEAAYVEENRLRAEAEAKLANMAAALEQANARDAWCRVAELEARLAAQQWRPGSEKPSMPEWYQVGDIDVGVYELWYSGEAWYRSPFQGATYRTPPLSAPDFWRPIPPLPPTP